MGKKMKLGCCLNCVLLLIALFTATFPSETCAQFRPVGLDSPPPARQGAWQRAGLPNKDNGGAARQQVTVRPYQRARRETQPVGRPAQQVAPSGRYAANRFAANQAATNQAGLNQAGPNQAATNLAPVGRTRSADRRYAVAPGFSQGPPPAVRRQLPPGVPQQFRGTLPRHQSVVGQSPTAPQRTQRPVRLPEVQTRPQRTAQIFQLPPADDFDDEFTPQMTSEELKAELDALDREYITDLYQETDAVADEIDDESISQSDIDSSADDADEFASESEDDVDYYGEEFIGEDDQYEFDDADMEAAYDYDADEGEAAYEYDDSEVDPTLESEDSSIDAEEKAYEYDYTYRDEAEGDEESGQDDDAEDYDYRYEDTRATEPLAPAQEEDSRASLQPQDSEVEYDPRSKYTPSDLESNNELEENLGAPGGLDLNSGEVGKRSSRRKPELADPRLDLQTKNVTTERDTGPDDVGLPSTGTAGVGTMGAATNLDPNLGGEPDFVVDPDRGALLQQRQTPEVNQQKMIADWPVRRLSLMEAVHLAIQNAPQVDILRSDVSIQQAEVARQVAAFDWLGFLETSWDDSSVPVGSDLTGAQDRFKDDNFRLEGGLSKRNVMGGDVRIGQEIGHQNTNSQFFNPPNQGTSRFILEYNQPLLRGAGESVNRSLIEIALSDRDAIEGDFVTGLQDYILDVTRAYWALAQARAQLNILNTSLMRAKDVASLMEKRKELDVGIAQSVRAAASAAARESDLVNAGVAVVQQQENLLQLIYGSKYTDFAATEIIPTDAMGCRDQSIAPENQVALALQNRPEIPAAIQRIRVAALEKGLAANQMLPALGLSLSLSNQGLRGNSNISGAFGDELTQGAPSYSVGFQFEQPIGRRAAKAGLRQSEWAVHRLQKEFETVVAAVKLEARNATHQANAASRNFRLKQTSLEMAHRELSVIQKRSELLIDGDAVGRLYLDDLLQTQDRLATAEIDLMIAEVECVLSRFELERACGKLLNKADADSLKHGFQQPVHYDYYNLAQRNGPSGLVNAGRVAVQPPIASQPPSASQPRLTAVQLPTPVQKTPAILSHSAPTAAQSRQPSNAGNRRRMANTQPTPAGNGTGMWPFGQQQGAAATPATGSRQIAGQPAAGGPPASNRRRAAGVPQQQTPMWPLGQGGKAKLPADNSSRRRVAGPAATPMWPLGQQATAPPAAQARPIVNQRPIGESYFSAVEAEERAARQSNRGQVIRPFEPRIARKPGN